jgi:hypothetical protein
VIPLTFFICPITQSINFNSFSIDQGIDATGVPTQVLSTDVATTLSYRNPSMYFGFHVSAPMVTLTYQQIVVAKGQVSHGSYVVRLFDYPLESQLYLWVPGASLICIVSLWMQSKKFFQKKKSTSSIAVDVPATRTPVYGAGQNLLSTIDGGSIPLKLLIQVQSEAHVIWKIVRPKYRSNIACDLLLNTNNNSGKIKITSQKCHRA